MCSAKKEESKNIPAEPQTDRDDPRASYVREDLLRQEARNGLPLAALSALLVVVLVIVGLLAAVVVGPGGAIGWVVTYLIPTLVILGALIGAFGLLM